VNKNSRTFFKTSPRLLREKRSGKRATCLNLITQYTLSNINNEKQQNLAQLMISTKSKKELKQNQQDCIDQKGSLCKKWIQL